MMTDNNDFELVKARRDACDKLQIAAAVKQCRISKQFDKTKIRIQLAMAEGNVKLMNAVIDYL
eukprot:15148866-Heterocapsa_arctica.AAC.1